MTFKDSLNNVDVLVILRTLFVAGILLLTAMTVVEYQGSTLIYLLFTIAANALLLLGIRRNAIFFDTFIGIFFWLGFWLKLSVKVAFLNGQFNVSVGEFDGSAMAFDSGLLVVIWAFAGLICFCCVREKWLFRYPTKAKDLDQPGLHEFYTKHRTVLLSGFVVFVLAVSISNAYLGIYQRGSVTKTLLPYGLNGVYKWLLIFGLASFSTLILKFEYLDNRRKSYTVAFIALFESCVSSVSLLSRGMILNAGALIYGLYMGLARFRVKDRFWFMVICVLLLMAFFVSSVVAVNYTRTIFYNTTGGVVTGESTVTEVTIANAAPENAAAESVAIANDTSKTDLVKDTIIHTQSLFLDRWVGIEGVFAVSSYPDRGWDLWWAAWQEKYTEDQLGFYDSKLIDTPYKNVDTDRHHFLSLPGIVAFCFYPGSHLFLFCCLFLAGLFAFLIELMVYKLGGRNIIFCAMIAQIVVFRYSNFGYVPGQSYLLFGSIVLNLGLIFLTDKGLIAWYRFRKTATAKS